MKQGQFEQLYQPLWHVMELEIIELEKPDGRLKGSELASFAAIVASAISTRSQKIATTPVIWWINSAI
jgi:hypothetical protein